MVESDRNAGAAAGKAAPRARRSGGWGLSGKLWLSFGTLMLLVVVNGGAKRDHLGGVRRDRLAAAGLSP